LVEFDDLQDVASQRGISYSFVLLCSSSDFVLLENVVRQRKHQGIIVPHQGLFVDARQELVTLLNAFKVPAIYPRRYFMDAGAAVVLTPAIGAESPRAAQVLVQILNGRDPATIPVQTPVGFKLIVNLEASLRTVGSPPSLLALRRADEILP